MNSDAAALRQAIMSAALQRKEAQARDAYADALVRQVLDGTEVRVPDSMVESQLTGLLHELESRLMSQGASLSDYLQMAGMTEEDLRAHARENALESARYELAMTEIARLEHIRVTWSAGIRRCPGSSACRWSTSASSCPPCS